MATQKDGNCGTQWKVKLDLPSVTSDPKSIASGSQKCCIKKWNNNPKTISEIKIKPKTKPAAKNQTKNTRQNKSDHKPKPKPKQI